MGPKAHVTAAVADAGPACAAADACSLPVRVQVAAREALSQRLAQQAKEEAEGKAATQTAATAFLKSFYEVSLMGAVAAERAGGHCVQQHM